MMSRLLKARATRAGVAVALVADVFAITAGSPSQAAPQSKTLTGSCVGADQASADLLKAFGGTLSMPFTVTSDVPATLEPEAADQPISFTWGVTIDAKTTAAVAAISPSLIVKNVSLDIGITGPTATTEVQGRPEPTTITVTAGQPATLTQGPFTGTLTKIGKGGIIKYSAKKVALTISLTIQGKATDVNVECTAPGTLAITSIKIPGSPDIKQPIEIEGTPNSTVDVDVLGQYVTAGTDEHGTVMPVKPETLRVIDGPGKVVDGKVQVSTGDAGTTASVTFEVCSGALPGTNEVQSLQIDPSDSAIKKSLGLTLKFGDEETDVIWSVPPEVVAANPDKFQKPTNWGTGEPGDEWNADMLGWMLTPFKLPEPAAIQAALEALPSIGKDGVKVTLAGEDKPGLYNIEFLGKNAERDVPGLTIGNYYSVFPQEHLQAILDWAKGLMGGGEGGEGGGGTPPPEVPPWMADLDINQIIAALTGMFTTPPSVATVVAGEEPIGICSQGVIDVAVPAQPTVVGGIQTPPPGSAPPPMVGAEQTFAG